MEEQWKCIKEYNNQPIRGNSLHIPGDKIWVSNTGKVRLNDEELTLNKGLYIRNGEIYIIGVGWPNKTMYRTIYNLFIGPTHNDVHHNIHHKDGNHFNNSADNLIELTAIEHAKIHGINTKETCYNGRIQKEWIKEQQQRSKKVIEQTRKWLKARVDKYLTDRTANYKEQLAIKHNDTLLRIKKDKEQLIKDKIASGKYRLHSSGKLVRAGFKRSKESNQKISNSMKQAYINNPELKKTCCHNKGKKLVWNDDHTHFHFE